MFVGCGWLFEDGQLGCERMQLVVGGDVYDYGCEHLVWGWMDGLNDHGKVGCLRLSLGIVVYPGYLQVREKGGGRAC